MTLHSDLFSYANTDTWQDIFGGYEGLNSSTLLIPHNNDNNYFNIAFCLASQALGITKQHVLDECRQYLGRRSETPESQNSSCYCKMINLQAMMKERQLLELFSYMIYTWCYLILLDITWYYLITLSESFKPINSPQRVGTDELAVDGTLRTSWYLIASFKDWP